MKVLIIGNLGYVGPCVVKHLRKVQPNDYLAGFDIGYFKQDYTCKGWVSDVSLDVQFYGDVRKFDQAILKGYDSVVYLAAISNDPMGNVFEKPTLDINYHAAVDIAIKAKREGVKSFVFASSCSVYGFADTEPRKEVSELNPLTAYAKSKVFAEIALEQVADKNFSVTCLRFATACGMSERLRLDLVLNDFVAAAIVDKKINILSDGSPWRPLIHVEDMARAIEWAIKREVGSDFLVINTGSNSWNYQVKELAYAVQQAFDDIEISINKDAQPDKRSYKVCFDLFENLAPDYQPNVTLQQAIDGIKYGLQIIGFNDGDFRQSKLIRLNSLKTLINSNCINQNLDKYINN